MSQIAEEGQIIADRFRVIRFIAEGGMGEVYEAEDLILRENVALKFLNRRALGDERALKRFRREIQLSRRITHPNVCRFFDVYRHVPQSGLLAGRPTIFVSMELLEGETLQDRIENRGRFAEKEALPLIAQMAAALTAAHEAGVVHRDFKAGNVMLVSRGGEPRVVVTDFGLARALSNSDVSMSPLTGEFKVVGTADYMAPEQMRGEDISPQSDIYALGVVIFEMIAGRRPYEAANPLTLLAKRSTEPPPSPREVYAGVSELWDSVILQCLASDPVQRPRRAIDVVALLAPESASESETLTINRPPELEGLKPPPKPPPHRSIGWVVALGLLVFSLAAVLIWRENSFADDPLEELLESFNPIQMTTSSGMELDPVFSPDGRELVYSADREGIFELYRRSLAGGESGTDERLTFSSSGAFEPAFSRDGERIAFHSGDGGIRIMPAQGGASSPLTNFGSRPAFLPDGSLVFQSESSPLLSDNTMLAPPLATLWRVDGDGADLRPLTKTGVPDGGHGAPAPSPDGSWLAFVRSKRSYSEIWAVSADGGEPWVVVEKPSAFDPVISPDGRSLFFSANLRQVKGLWRQRIDRAGRPVGEPERMLNLGVISMRQLAISQTSQRIAYLALSSSSNLWSLPMIEDADGERGDGEGGAADVRVHPLTTGNGRHTRPSFSPDGRRVAFERWQLGISIDIWAMDRDGRETRQITKTPADNFMARWHPEGDRLAYLARYDRDKEFREIPVAGGESTKLLDLPVDADWAVLSPEGLRVAYHEADEDGAANLMIHDLTDGSTRQLTFSDGFMGYPCWSQDGRWLTFQKQRGENSSVMVIPDTGGEPQQLTFRDGHHWPYSFSPDGDKIAFVAFREGVWNLWWVSRSTGEQRRLTSFDRASGYVRYPEWSPSGDQIIFENSQTESDIWIVEHENPSARPRGGSRPVSR